METHFFHILNEKTIKNGIVSPGWHLIPFKNLCCYVLLNF